MTDLAPQSLWGLPVIVGAGVAGAVAALTLAPRPVLLLDAAPGGDGSSSRWAQGGLAAAVGPDDSPALQTADTIAVGAGLNESEIAAQIIAAGPATVAALEAFGVRFDRAADGAFALGLEAAHARRRILHVRDATGKAILEALTAQIARTESVTRISGSALRLETGDGRITGVTLAQADRTIFLPTGIVILATGGVGGLWRSTTNPAGSRGGGLALAARAGAALQDIEFVQFHPTALVGGADPMPLISEAVRGEGALLIDADGRRFMEGVPGGELAPRDILARAVFAQWATGAGAALDARHWPSGKFAARFPTIHGVLAESGLDPERDPIPVRPAAHYHMGGVKVDARGRSSVEGLWAIGEVASTGLHGANRLASNSLLEAAVCGRLAGEDVGGVTLAHIVGGDAEPVDPSPADPEMIAQIRRLMDDDVGVVRHASGLARAVAKLGESYHDAIGSEASDIAGTALLIALAAERRTESRGAHYRSDCGAAAEPHHSQSRWTELP